MPALDSLWHAHGLRSTALLPLAAVFGAIAARRRRRQERTRTPSPLPVLVIGNITVGGTGKTPLVAAVAAICTARGIRCGIVSRGYGGRARRTPVAVDASSDPGDIGDEPLMLRRLTGVPVMVCVERAAAVAALAARGDIDLVLADDGLQHYAMARAAEICVVDGASGLGNARLLPAGPLREPVARLAQVDVIAVRGEDATAAPPPGIARWPVTPLRGSFELVPDRLLAHDGGERPLCSLDGLRVHAVAGIGRPQRLFDTARALGADVIAHPFPDHHRYRARDLQFGDALPILTTAKDAVKIARLAMPAVELLELQMRADLSASLEAALHVQLDRLVTDREAPT